MANPNAKPDENVEEGLHSPTKSRYVSDSNDIAILYSQSFVVKDEVKARVSERGKTVQKVFRIAHAEWSSGDGSYRYKLKNRTDEKRVGGGEGTWFLEDDLSFAR